jgi:hypothetical protein
MRRPYWTVTSVYITSNPLTGATGSKARYRMLGTLIGAAGTIVPVGFFFIFRLSTAPRAFYVFSTPAQWLPWTPSATDRNATEPDPRAGSCKTRSAA